MSAEAALASGPLRVVQGGAAIPRYGVRREALGDPTPLACTVAKAALEITLGAEGLDRLVRWVASDVRDTLAARHSGARKAGMRGAVASIDRARICRVSHRVAEASIIATVRGHTIAIAMRLEDVHGRWLATVIEMV